MTKDNNDKALYTEIRYFNGSITEKTVLYETNDKLYVSYIKMSPRGACGHYRPATLNDHAVATLALVEQLNAKFPH